MADRENPYVIPYKDEKGRIRATVSPEAVLILADLDAGEVAVIEAFIEACAVNAELSLGRGEKVENTGSQGDINGMIIGMRLTAKMFEERVKAYKAQLNKGSN